MLKKIVPFSLVLICLILLAGCTPAPDAPEQPTVIVEQVVEEEEVPATETLPPPTDEPEEDSDELESDEVEGEEEIEMSLTSPAFNHEEVIPVKFSCDGEDVSPDLDWFGIPEGAKSIALIMDDPDAPAGTWVHWVLFNIPADIPGLQEGISGVGVDGNNSWGRTGYGGPCPPGGTHRYFFKLYALDKLLELEPGATKEAVLEAMDGHILGEAVLMGTYTR